MSIFSFLTPTQAAEPLNVGDAAPAVSALDQDGKTVSLAEVYTQGIALVYFYPKSDTPGCTAEACSLRDAFADLQKLGVRVIGVSTDSVEAQKKFQQKYNLPFTILSDKDKKVTAGFGVPTTVGFASRQSFLIKDGKIVWRDLKASTAKQAADVLAAVQALTPAK